MSLQGKTAIVTGGGRDIGKHVSLKLASLGASVVINYRSSEKEAHATLNEITDSGGSAIAVQGDMMKMADAQHLVQQAQEAFGRDIHILINNAGGLVARKTLDEQDEDFYDLVMDLNVKTTWLATKAVKPSMPSGGVIINFSSQAARDGGGGGSTLYSASKGAISTLTRGWAKEFGPEQIRVNCVCPGMIDTTFHDTFTKPEIREKVAATTPLRREGRPHEVADLVAYLVSDQSSYINGANIDINGGMVFS
jgi:3-oxoacyl-[acyl-carrier protein] reductase